ncbi:hypothetical protein DGWBC_1607 [Dehalogenimonas sp. WBC-2]|nr:hypothetical protein DGWBC_1607 [Dehalogenimonas sp. WBC-2]
MLPFSYLSAATLTFNLPGSAFPGDTITVSGTADYQSANPNMISISITGIGTYYTLVSSNGKFSSSIIIPPDAAGGEHSVQISSSLTHESSSALLNIMPQIFITASSGRPGDMFSVSGAGFLPNESVELFFYNATYGSSPGSINPSPINTTSLISTASGGLNSYITVPKYPQGAYSIVASDKRNTSAPANFTVTSSIALPETLDTIKIFSEGDQLLVTGAGFAAGSIVTFKIDNVNLTGFNAAVLSDGCFSTSITIPALSRGYHNIVASDSARNTSAAVSFILGTSIRMTPVSGTAGTVITIKGSGFNGVQLIQITYDDKAVTTTPAVITSAANGTFSATFTVPGALEGNHAVIASDGTNSSVAYFTSTLTATINLITDVTLPGYVGQEIIVEGKGFNPGATVTAKYDATSVGSATASNTGAFTIKFKARSSTAGVHVITVSDGVNTRTFPYYMECTPPLVPVLIAPLDGTAIKQPVVFEWQALSDPSGVIYTLQISQDPTFSSILIEKRLIDTPTCVMDVFEKLPANGRPYFWRVSATDGAGNASIASTPRSFIIWSIWTSLPSPFFFFIGAIAPLFLAGTGFLLLRRFSIPRARRDDTQDT